MLHTPGSTSSICSCPCGLMLHTTSSACPCAGLLPGLSLGYYEVTVCPLALRGHELNGIQNPAPCPSRALSCAQVSAHLLALRTPPPPCSPAPGAKQRAMPGVQPSSVPTARAPSCSPGSAPSQPVHRAAAQSYSSPGPPSPAALRKASARFPAHSTNLRRGPGPVPARPCPLLQPAPRTAAAAPRHGRLCRRYANCGRYADSAGGARAARGESSAATLWEYRQHVIPAFPPETGERQRRRPIGQQQGAGLSTVRQ